jgi:hypothetical protein
MVLGDLRRGPYPRTVRLPSREGIGFTQLLRIGPLRALRYVLLPNVTTALLGVGMWMHRMG